MRYLILIAVLLCGTSYGTDPSSGRDSEAFKAYQERRKERRVYALQRRREINAMRPPAVYGYRQMPVNVLNMPSAISMGHVPQPRLVVPHCSPRRATFYVWR